MRLKGISDIIADRVARMERAHPNMRSGRVITNYGNGLFKVRTDDDQTLDDVPATDSRLRNALRGESIPGANDGDDVKIGFHARKWESPVIIGWASGGSAPQEEESLPPWWPRLGGDASHTSHARDTLLIPPWVGALDVDSRDTIKLRADGALIYQIVADGTVRTYSFDGAPLGAYNTPLSVVEAWIDQDIEDGLWTLGGVFVVLRFIGGGDPALHTGLSLPTCSFEPATLPRKAGLDVPGYVPGMTDPSLERFIPQLWTVDASDATHWTWHRIQLKDIATVIGVTGMDWADWSFAGPLPHTLRRDPDDPSAPRSYPVHVFEDPYSILDVWKSTSRALIVTPGSSTDGGIIVPPTDYAEWLTLSRESRDIILHAPDPTEDEEVHNDAHLWGRPQVMGFDPVTGAVQWTVDGWGNNEITTEVGELTTRAAFSVVGQSKDKTLLHFTRRQYECQEGDDVGNIGTFKHPIARLDLQDTYRLLHDTDPDAFGPRSWPEWVPAPSWAWNPAYCMTRIAAVVAESVPTFSNIVTRDMQTAIDHGFATVRPDTGEILQVKMIDKEDERSPVKQYVDTGDPLCNVHKADGFPPRVMYYDTYRLISFTTGSAMEDAHMEAAAGIDDDERFVSWVGLNTFEGNIWTGDDGHPHSIFIGAFARYLGDWSGSDIILPTPPTSGQGFIDSVDPIGRWSNRTISNLYYAMILRRKPVECWVGDLSYGWDPYNIVTDGERFFALPRVIQDGIEPPGDDDIPRPPAAEDLVCVVQCIEGAGLSWKCPLGKLHLQVAPVGAAFVPPGTGGSVLFVWVPGKVYKFDGRSGAILGTIEISESNDWTRAAMQIVDGAVWLGGNTGLWKLT